MLAKRIIPCLDVKNGRTVKGINFVGLTDVGDPVELGAKYAKDGADELVFLDISATLEERSTFAKLVSRIADRLNIPFTVGGGIASRYGSQFVVVAIDAKLSEGVWHVTTHGGSKLSDRELFSWAKLSQEMGAGEIMFTSMNHDGTREGYPCDTFAKLAETVSIPIIASGGAGSVKDIADVLTTGHADAALAASIFHYGEITIPELKRQLSALNIPVRL